MSIRVRKSLSRLNPLRRMSGRKPTPSKVAFVDEIPAMVQVAEEILPVVVQVATVAERMLPSIPILIRRFRKR